MLAVCSSPYTRFHEQSYHDELALTGAAIVQVLEALLGWCEGQLAGYTSAVQNDEEEMAQPATPWLRTQVLRALVSEKKTLMGLQRQLRDRMQQLKEGCPLETLYV